MKTVYADNAASTPTDDRVIEAYNFASKQFFANPSSLHDLGAKSAQQLEVSRKTVAEFIGASAEEIYFCSTGSEALNLAILGCAKASTKKHIITTKIEHPAVLNACLASEKNGYTVTYLEVDNLGQINIEELSQTITEQTLMFISAYGNSELGTLVDIQKISKICKQKNVLLVIDACQSAAYLTLDVSKLGANLLVFNGSKMYGPKGVSALYIKEGTEILPIIYGGGQERSLRSGTENLPAIIAFAKACEIISEERESFVKTIKELRNLLQKEMEGMGFTINAQSASKLPNHLSVIVDTQITDVVTALSELGICVSSGSACSQKSLAQSHILRAIGLSGEQINKTIRITLGKYSQKSDITAIIKALKLLQRR